MCREQVALHPQVMRCAPSPRLREARLGPPKTTRRANEDWDTERSFIGPWGGGAPLLTQRTCLEPDGSRMPYFSLWPLTTEQNQDPSHHLHLAAFTGASKGRKETGR